MRTLWDRVLENVGNRLPQTDRAALAGRTRALGERDRALVVEVQSSESAELGRRHRETIEAGLREVSGGRLAWIIYVSRDAPQQELFPQEEPVPPPAPAPPSPHRRASLLPKYTFDQFVVGASNQFAHAAARAVANQPGDHYNPLFIYGGVGLGKTHLANAIGHEILRRNPNARIVYLSSESFMNELISALRRDRMDDFKNRFRRTDVLILDDVQFLAGRERTQEEFFHTFNSLYESRRQIVLTSDKFPKEIPDMEERLRNRFEWGLIADIQPPDMETRVAIIEKKAEVEHFELPHEVAIFLASRIDSNVRELEGSLTRLGAFASLNKCSITIDFAREVLKSVLHERKEKSLTIESIQQIVCDFFHLRVNELRSKRRARTIALPRQVAMYLCRRHTAASFPVIGDRFGGRDHSTVIHATQVIDQRLRSDAAFRATVEQIERLLEQAVQR